MTLALHIQQVGRALRPQAWHDQHNDPCDPWPLFMWNGQLCRLAQVTMWHAPDATDRDAVSWEWLPGWLCYVVNIAVPLGQPMPLPEVEGPLAGLPL